LGVDEKAEADIASDCTDDWKIFVKYSLMKIDS